ncbi:MAG: A/G-specific adenine glycosylase [Elusimicrobia bacterium]|nr:A/G-specific adenine glycosylase [Elusimicrobiota bacterium]
MKRQFRKKLLAWYRRHRRDLPWRKTKDPYKIWVSEIMLQQTQVQTVLPHYRRFLRRFPNLLSLARSPLSAALSRWTGLGYYARARNLHRSSQILRDRHQGKFPNDLREAMRLPGIGRSTAGAILSMGFQQPHPVLDANAVRVLCRLLGIAQDPQKAPVRRRLWRSAEALLDPQCPGDFNQALMELGATCCLPTHPHCLRCPVSGFCRARRENLQDKLPIQRRRLPLSRPLRLHCLWYHSPGKVLIVQRGLKEKILKGQWGLPEAPHNSPAPQGRLLARVPHQILHYRIELKISQAPRPRPPQGSRWIPLSEVGKYLYSSLWHKAIRAVQTSLNGG